MCPFLVRTKTHSTAHCCGTILCRLGRLPANVCLKLGSSTRTLNASFYHLFLRPISHGRGTFRASLQPLVLPELRSSREIWRQTCQATDFRRMCWRSTAVAPLPLLALLLYCFVLESRVDQACFSFVFLSEEGHRVLMVIGLLSLPIAVITRVKRALSPLGGKRHVLNIAVFF